MSGLVIDTLYNFYFHFHIYIEKNNLKDYFNLNYSQKKTFVKNIFQKNIKHTPEEYQCIYLLF